MSFNFHWKILNTPCRYNFYSQIDRNEVYLKPTLKTFIRLERSHWNIGIGSFQIPSHELFYSGTIWTLAGCSFTFYIYMFHGSTDCSVVLQHYSSTVLQLCSSTVLQYYSSSVLHFFSSTVLSSTVRQCYSSSVLHFFSSTVRQFYRSSVLQFFSSTFL